MNRFDMVLFLTSYSARNTRYKSKEKRKDLRETNPLNKGITEPVGNTTDN